MAATEPADFHQPQVQNIWTFCGYTALLLSGAAALPLARLPAAGRPTTAGGFLPSWCIQLNLYTKCQLMNIALNLCTYTVYTVHTYFYFNVVDSDSEPAFQVNPDSETNPEFLWPKIEEEKNIAGNLCSFLIKNCKQKDVYVFSRQKTTSSTSKDEIYQLFSRPFLLSWIRITNPDPDTDPGSPLDTDPGSPLNPDQIRIWIHNTAFFQYSHTEV